MTSDLTAIVTGGSSGIGRAVCIALADMGYRLMVVGQDANKLRQTIALLDRPEEHEARSLDVTQAQSMAQMAKEAVTLFGRIDVLVASAGIGRSAKSDRLVPYPTTSLPLSEWNAILDVNLKGVFLSNRAVLPQMLKQQSGQIINICSSTTPKGLRGEPFAPAYCASKFGVVGFTESLSQEVSSQGVRVQALFPGMVRTPMVAHTAISHRYGGSISAAELALTIGYMVQQPFDSTIVHPHVLPTATLQKLEIH